MSYKQYGGINKSNKHMYVHATHLSADKLDIQTAVGLQNTKYISDSHYDLNNNSLLNTGSIIFSDGTVQTTAFTSGSHTFYNLTVENQLTVGGDTFLQKTTLTTLNATTGTFSGDIITTNGNINADNGTITALNANITNTLKTDTILPESGTNIAIGSGSNTVTIKDTLNTNAISTINLEDDIFTIASKNLSVGKGFVQINGPNASYNMGYLDFTSEGASDFDVRLGVTGGSSGNTGQGDLAITANTVTVNGGLVLPDETVTSDTQYDSTGTTGTKILPNTIILNQPSGTNIFISIINNYPVGSQVTVYRYNSTDSSTIGGYLYIGGIAVQNYNQTDYVTTYRCISNPDTPLVNLWIIVSSSNI